jgi:hypothetical protein
MRCAWCGLYLCEDCFSPKKHYCPTYLEDVNCAEISTKKTTIIDSNEICKQFASKFLEEEKEVPMLSRSEIEKRIASGTGITLDVFMCPRCKTNRDIDRFMCPHCKTKRNLMCVWCGMHFCKVCIEPERHDCLEHINRLKKSARSPESSKELVNTFEQESLVDTSINGHIDSPEQSTSYAELPNTNLGNEGSKVKEKAGKKISLGRKIRSIFGFVK